jgi:flagellar hook-associated protein 1
LTDLLGIGKSGLFASKQSMATTSHNIANANTDGFSRQEVRQETGITIKEGDYALGTGTNIASIKRSHDTLVEKKLNKSISQHKFNEERSTQLGHVEEIFNEINSEGMNKLLNRFFNSFRELANQPENETIRGMVRENARIVIGDFHRIQDHIDHTRAGIHKQLDLVIKDVNSLTANIAKLNKEIAAIEVTGADANDLRDQRDRDLRSLAEYFPVTAYDDEKNQFVVSIEGVGSLVAGEVTQQLAVGPTVGEETSEDKGQFEVFFKSRPGNPISTGFKSGIIGGLVKTRNEEIKRAEHELDQLAHGLIHATNAIHRRGFANIPVDPELEKRGLASVSNATNLNFFKEPIDLKRAAEYIDLSDEIKEDVNNIAAALAPNSPGDNRVAIAISKLQHEKVLDGGTTSFEEHYQKTVGHLGLVSSKTRVETEQSGGILAQAKSIKERISGVSLDEEAANMVRYQNAYEASAKVIKAADEMFKTVLGIME